VETSNVSAFPYATLLQGDLTLKRQTAGRLLQETKINSFLWLFLFLGQNRNAGAAAAHRAF
jgi:hypothetical protein